MTAGSVLSVARSDRDLRAAPRLRGEASARAAAPAGPTGRRALATLALALCPFAVICADAAGSRSLHAPSPRVVEQRRAVAGLQAFARPALPRDFWPGGRTPLSRVDASRLVAVGTAVAGDSWRLYLLRGPGETCLELYGVTGDCNTGGNFFSGAPFEIVEYDGLVAALVANRIERLSLATPAGEVPVALSPDKGTLFTCSQTTSGRCRGDALVGFDGENRVVFRVSL